MRRGISCLMILLLFVALCPKIQAAELGEGTKSAVLLDIATGTVLFEKNAHEALPPASVTKVMTLLLIMEAIDGGQIGWDDIVTASEAAAAKGGSQISLKAGEQLTVSDMVKSIAVSSANDCACAMAEHLAGSEGAFADKMNQRAAELGMTDSHFVNCTGLDDDDSAKEHRTSAMDIAIMSRELLKNHPDITKYTTIWMDTVRNGAFGLSNTNKLIRFYPGATGLKTGFTRPAMYFLSASAECRAQRRYRQLQEKGIEEPYADVLRELEQRDYDDTHRAVAPLKAAPDAVHIDTSDLTLDESIDAVCAAIRTRFGVEGKA